MKKISATWLVLIQLVLAYEWLHSGWGKWTGAGFMNGIGSSIANFAAKTPHEWFGTFLTTSVEPHAILFGNLVRSGEILVGIALLVGSLLLIARQRIPLGASWLLIAAHLGGAFMNLNFYLAAGATSPSTAGINLVMLLMHLVFAAFYIRERRSLA